MNFFDYITEIFPKTINYRLSRLGLVKPEKPITLTFSVTAACNSLCKTCQIGLKFRENPKLKEDDLSIEEISKIFQSLGHVYFFNISGGEPFLRNDLPQIVRLACQYLTPKIIHIPTNALLPDKIYEDSKQILAIIKECAPKTQFSVKPSIDGVGQKHDEIRGVQGNFHKLEKTIDLLKGLQEDSPNFHLELGTVVSKFNLNDLEEIEDYVHSKNVESYRNEIAEQREEFFNIGDPITPTAEEYKTLMQRFKDKIRKNIAKKKGLAKTTEALRLVYYDLAAEIIEEKTQVIPCYAGISNVHINYNGDVWPCCVLAFSQSLGNLRKNNYDFSKIWYSHKANQVRKFIKDKNCACPLANQAYSNILCHSGSLLKTIINIIRFTFKK